MKKNNRHAKRRKYRPLNRIVTTSDPGEREAFYGSTDADAPLGKYQIAAGAIQNPITGLWQLWISTNGLDINHISAYRDKARAEAAVEAFRQFAHTDDIYDPEKVTAFYERFIEEEDAEPEPLPDALVRTIARNILETVIKLDEK